MLPSFATSLFGPLEVDAGECEGLDSTSFCDEDFAPACAGPQGLWTEATGLLTGLLEVLPDPSSGKSAEVSEGGGASDK